MRRSRVVDWVLIALFLPPWLLLFCVTVQLQITHGARVTPFLPIGAQSASSYPSVGRVQQADSPVRGGDRLIRIGNRELRGLSVAGVFAVMTPLQRQAAPLHVEVERDGHRFETEPDWVPEPYWWAILVGAAGIVAAATFLLLRAPYWHLSRRFFVASMLCGLALVAGFHPAGSSAPLGPYWMLGVGSLAVLSAIVVTLWTAFEFTESAGPAPKWGWIVFLAIGLAFGINVVLWFWCTFPTGLWPVYITWVSTLAFSALLLIGLTRGYRRAEPLERRQLKWVLYGFYIALLPQVLVVLAELAGIYVTSRPLAAALNLASFAIPLGFVIAVVGYRFLDIDRLISMTASYSLVGVALLGSALVFVPKISRAASEAVGVAPETGQWMLSLALAGVLVPVHRALRPWIDRRLFAERYALTQSFERLLGELSGCTQAEELTKLSGARLDALLHPESIVIYARAGDAFTPVFARGRAAPPAFEAGSLLVRTLESQARPLFAGATKIDPFERAALQTLGVEVVTPTLRNTTLVAFTCLGPKRSGDIYTQTDLALLAAVAHACSEVLARLDQTAIAREAGEMQAALRRYVPGAIAQQISQRQELEPREREVSILFVDIRDYTHFAAVRPAEDVFATVNEQTERVSALVQSQGGVLVEFNGDGMMAVFGAPDPLASKERAAVEAARKIVDSMPASLAVGVGIATGPAFVGNLRASDRLIWSAIGSTTNLAARLQSLTRELRASIAMDATTHARAGYVCADFVRHEKVAIRGREEREEVFALPLRAVGAA
ncbi:MAG TPA: adenylate/guanylate cyclase domain-containing protein [Myxococcota bacterium]|nr:adenylate/guanylate cyclase domain-containing protein [Myxococcota bacterium]